MLLYYIVPKRIQWIPLFLLQILLLSRLDRFSWIAIGVTVFATYLFSRVGKGNKPVLIVYLVCQIGMMLGFKIFTETMPFGLSYYGLMAVGYSMEVYRGNTNPDKNPFRMALELTLFPLLIQGPIRNMSGCHAGQLQTPKYFSWHRTEQAVARILWGCMKKMVIADRIAPAVEVMIRDPQIYTGGYVLLGMLFYAVQLYADFTGGIDIALGIANYLGLNLEENFQVPFTSKNLGEYWRRWHISLGEWMKEYIFYPVSVSWPVTKIASRIRKKNRGLGRRIPVYTASILTWFATGLWHGSEAHFIFWGMANCFIILISRELKPAYDRFHRRFPTLTGEGKTAVYYGYFQAVRTFLLVCLLRMTDCYRDVGLTFRMFFSIFTDFGKGISLAPLGLAVSDYLLIGTGILFMYLAGRVKKKEKPEQWFLEQSVGVRYLILAGLFFSILVFGIYGIGYEQRQFIYNQV